MTREEIKEFSGVEPNCFETDREEYWYKIGCIDGLNTADADPDTSSLWHYASEEPKGDIAEILCMANRFSRFTAIISFINWKLFCDKFDIKQWAYVNDLLPKGGEE